MLGREVNLPIEVVLGTNPPTHKYKCYCDYVENLKETMLKVHELARSHLQRCTERQNRDYDTRMATATYKVGDLVYYIDETKTVGKSPKLQKKWIGPCVVVRKLSDLVYDLKPRLKANGKRRHRDKLKMYCSDQIPDWVQLVRKKLSPATVSRDSTQCSAEPAAKPVPLCTQTAESAVAADKQGQGMVTQKSPDPGGVDTTVEATAGSNPASRTPRVRRQPQRYGCPVQT